MQMFINNALVPVDWQNNSSVQALEKLVSDKPLTIRMSRYGGFEQVGPIGRRLPDSDKHTVTSSGDIVLYNGNQLVVFYGSNSWAYTRLGKVNYSNSKMRELLGNGDVTITITK